jgi:hypothetical protein
MGDVVHPTARRDESKADLPTLPRNSEKLNTQALQQQNAQLRELVVQLSKIVVKVVVDHH